MKGDEEKGDEQEFECGRVVLDRLFVLSQRECPLRVIERVVDSRGWLISGGFWLGLLLTADRNPPMNISENRKAM
jgi:hypothetical protein